MATTSLGFLRTPGELTIPPDVRLDGTQHEGVAIRVTRITLASSLFLFLCPCPCLLGFLGVLLREVDLNCCPCCPGSGGWGA